MKKQPAKKPSLWAKIRSIKLLYNLLVMAVLILGMALLAHLAMQIGTRHGARRTVPDFAGIPLAEAEELAASCDLQLHINDSLFVPAYEGGIVLDQLPEQGVEVKPGRTVYITINSFRQKMVPIPYVAGRSLRQAKNMLEIAGLEIEELHYRPDMATNYVLEAFYDREQITEERELQAEMGSGITLYVGVDPEKNATAVPLVVGLSLREAKSRIWESGLNVGKVHYDEGINLLNQKEARVYMQSLGAEQITTLGRAVALHLTLDGEKSKAAREVAAKEAAERAKAQAEMERTADSLAALEEAGLLEETLQRAVEQSEAATTDDEFFE